MQQEQALRTLRYWFDVEALTAPDAEDDTDRSPDHFVTYVRDGVLPWQAKFRHQPERPHKHFVRFGVVPRASYDQELLAVVRTDAAPDHDTGGRKDRKAFTFLGVFEVDATGSPQAGTLQLAAFATAFASLRSGERVEFGKYQQTVTEYFDDTVQHLKDEGTPADAGFIQGLLTKALGLLKWTPTGMDKAPSAIVVSRAVIGEDGRPRNPQIEPVNGFFLDDIDSVIRDVRVKASTGLVLPYLAEPNERNRVDCTKMEVVDRALTVNRLPDGRWPTEFPLTLMQQVAVNEGLHTLAPGGLFSINGPPGTGKTTLLMDVVAAVIVERAKVLATFAQPKDAFTKRWQVKYQNLPNPATVYALDSRLHEFTMVVTSANNGAVENVTRELPNLSKIAPQYQDAASYFAPTATALLNVRVEGDEDDAADDEKDTVEAWGLISAVLGKKANRTIFANTLDAKNRQGEPEPANIYRQIAEAAGTLDWATARQEFRDAVARVGHLKSEIAKLERAAAVLQGLSQAVVGWERELVGRSAAFTAAQGAVAAAETVLAEREEEFRSADKGADLRRPGGLVQFLAMLPSALPMARSAKDKVAAFEAAVETRSACEKARAEARAALKQARATAEAAGRAVADAQQQLTQAKATFASTSAQVETLRRGLKGLIGFDQVLAASEDDRQQLLPRSCDALNDARAQVFLKAMALHRAFIVGADKVFQGNLKRAIGMLNGDPNMTTVVVEAGKDLWATLSLLVPVVSTTFASFARCFTHMPRGGIGWLFVDEAGQAVPQHAVGALARAKRALIVGDPLQVEPVITLDKNIDAKLLERHGAGLRHLSTGTSLQALADQNNPFGTYLTSHTGEPVWVGSPLKVHRRCVEPMFSISNKIAYNRTMVLGRGKAEQEAKLTDGDPAKGRAPRPLFGPSCWIDVQGTEGCENHYIPAQAKVALGIVKAYVASGWLDEKRKNGLPDLFIISPFKSAAAGMRGLLKRTRRDWADHIPMKEFDAWVKRSVGTVHTFQGKEAESVILLLGGKTPGAVKWAASTPNILNVAVTRAQRRVYVVGDWAEWMKWPLVKGTMSIDGWKVSEQDALERIQDILEDDGGAAARSLPPAGRQPSMIRTRRETAPT